MRVGWQCCIGIFFTIFLCLLIFPGDADGSYIILEDDFTGTDGSSPDTSKWFTQTYDGDDYVEIESNTVRTHSVDGVYARLWTKDAFDTDHFTLEVDMQPRVLSGRILEITVETRVGDVYNEMLALTYLQANGWEYIVRVNGNQIRVTSNVNTLQRNNWYTLNLTVDQDEFKAVVTPRGATSIIWDSGSVNMDALNGRNVIHIGSASWAMGDPSANWDNFVLWNHNPPPQLPQPPEWGELDTFNAVEDVRLVHDFTTNVSDPDTPLVDLTIEADSTYVVAQDRLTLTFLFPNGVTEATVPLNLTDGLFTIRTDVEFSVEPVNDPPDHDAPSEYIAWEDVPRVIDMTPYVWDIDNATEDLYLITDDQFAEADRLELTVTFPDGVLTHEITVDLTDGLLMVSIGLSFDVVPVNDPPVLDLPDMVNVTEDKEITLDLNPLIDDIDSPKDNLIVVVENEHVTVEGHRLIFYYTTGVEDHSIVVEVTDGFRPGRVADAVANAPTGDGVCFREPGDQNRTFAHAGE